MAGDDISIGVAADAREFTTGIDKGVIKPLDGVEKALEDVAKEGDQAGDKLEHALDGARQETSKFKQDQSDLARAVAAGQKDGTKSIELNNGQRTKIVRQGAKQAGAAAKAQLGGDLSQMTATSEGAVAGIGNTVGGILAGFGPIGAGIAAAVGIATGLIGGALHKSAEETKKNKEQVAQLAATWIEAGNASTDSVATQIDNLKKMATVTDGSVKSLKDIRTEAEKTGVPFKTLALAYAGSTDAQKEAIDINKKAIAQAREQVAASGNVGRGSGQLTLGLSKDNQKQIRDLEEKGKVLADARDQAEAYFDALDSAAVKSEQVQKDYAEATKEQFSDIQAELEKQADEAQAKADARAEKNKTKAKKVARDSAADFLKVQQKELQAAAEYTETSARIYEKFGATAGAAILKSVKPGELLSNLADAKPEQVAQIKSNYTELGRLAGVNVTKGLKAAMPAEITGPRVTLESAGFERDLKALTKNRTVKLDLVGVYKPGRPIVR